MNANVYVTYRFLLSDGWHNEPRVLGDMGVLPRVGERVHLRRAGDAKSLTPKDTTLSGTVSMVYYKEDGTTEPFDLPAGIVVQVNWDGIR